jgi:hypothetical protein
LNSTTEPGGSKILAGNSEVFKAKYGFYPDGQFTRSLSNTGEKLILNDGFGNVIDEVDYSDQPPWPDARANGLYIELTDLQSDNNIGSNWKASGSVIVSVNDIIAEKVLKVYPSPVTDVLKIESETSILTVDLYDIRGIRLQTQFVNSECYDVDMTSFSPGIYVVKVFTPDGSYFRKIIKK